MATRAEGKPIRKKDKKITILQWSEGTDQYGQPLEEYIPISGGENIWAYYRQASANEFYSAMQVNVEVEAVFGVNWRGDLDTSMRVRYRGEDYEISRIDDFEGYKKDLIIYAHKIN